ncbi:MULTISPECIES: putative leader peptide [Streptomyces]|nr:MULTISPECIES: putative leader peptide [Streptomyces]EIF89928.1 hypothetical protein [Streptomyces tsukubensis NRRL18488]
MVLHDMSDKTQSGAVLLVARLHVDLCRLASALCTRAGRSPRL